MLKLGKRIFISEEAVKQIENACKINKNKNIENRLKVLVLHTQGLRHGKIAEKTDFVVSYISELIQKYNKYGLSSIIENHYQGNHRNLSFKEEKALLEPFKESAASGQMVDISEIKVAYEKATGKSLDNNHGQIYRVLQRHGWRKVMPRSKHPKKASDEVIEASKKLTKPSKARWKILQVDMSGSCSRMKLVWVESASQSIVGAFQGFVPLIGESAFLVLPYSNTVCMNIFLKHLSDSYPDDRIILDSYHELNNRIPNMDDSQILYFLNSIRDINVFWT